MQILLWDDFKDQIENHDDFIDRMYELIINKLMNDCVNKKQIVIDNFNYSYLDFCLFSVASQCTQLLDKKLIIIVNSFRPFYIFKMKKYNHNCVIARKFKLDTNSLLIDSEMYHNQKSHVLPTTHPFLPHELATIKAIGLYGLMPKRIKKNFEYNYQFDSHFYKTIVDMLKKDLI